ncbi:TetR/AcrR family transcriptional regulator [Arthrobacter sp. ISL-95]|uniref:TetR/AcrR family transcriptional regulator n=1 Tax=Arthrobacter sp. ISL-95 TaxID=2819116 RepID=UPI001BEB7F80|nr:TetR/AcrR family transcriptional regulator [Arthrobacter sp. ISL-95]MBT2585275.1 TetR/AcrR family transcriptional regulator [Arthrobacter sp. ISL-95]
METQSGKRSARDRLLDAADELFSLNGITHTGVDDVLVRAEVSVATLYAKFGSKDGLLRASLERRLETWQVYWDAAIAAAESDEDRLLALFDALTLYRDNQHSARWCAFLSAAVEINSPSHSAADLIKADTALLNDRLLHLSGQIVGAGAGKLAAAILLIYNGTLASLLRGSPVDPIPLGREVARSTVRAQTS